MSVLRLRFSFLFFFFFKNKGEINPSLGARLPHWSLALLQGSNHDCDWVKVFEVTAVCFAAQTWAGIVTFWSYFSFPIHLRASVQFLSDYVQSCTSGFHWASSGSLFFCIIFSFNVFLYSMYIQFVYLDGSTQSVWSKPCSVKQEQLVLQHTCTLNVFKMNLTCKLVQKKIKWCIEKMFLEHFFDLFAP